MRTRVVPPARRAAVFVDGENTAVRFKHIKTVAEPWCVPRRDAVTISRKRKNGSEDVAFWSPKVLEHYLLERLNVEVLRTSYYTSSAGAEETLCKYREKLQEAGIGTSWVIHKKNNESRPKGVDVRLATDVTVAAVSHQVDDIVLVSNDRDFLPIVETAKNHGARVFLAFPGLDLVGEPRVVNQEALTQALGIVLPSDYTLAFDAVLADIPWFDRRALTAEEMTQLWEQYVQPEILGSGGNPELIKQRFLRAQMLRTPHYVMMKHEGWLDVGHGNTAIGRPVWPLSTLREWLRYALRESGAIKD